MLKSSKLTETTTEFRLEVTIGTFLASVITTVTTGTTVFTTLTADYFIYIYILANLF
jgi:hypothetical protein